MAIEPQGAEAAADRTAGRAGAALFGALSRLRGRRVFHPDGVGFEGALTVHGRKGEKALGAALVDEPAVRECVVRFSRGLGLPEPLPDVLGIALRVEHAWGPGQPLDLLLVTAPSPRVARHVLRPARGFAGPHYSTLLPYEIAGRRVLFGARVVAPSRLATLADVVEAAAAGALRVDIDLARGSGAWEPIGTVQVGRPLSVDAAERLRFNVWHAGVDVQPVGLLNAARRRAYEASQRARPA